MSDQLILTHTPITVDFWANNGDHRTATLWLPDEIVFGVEDSNLEELKADLRKELIERDSSDGTELVAAEVASVTIEIHGQRRPSIFDRLLQAVGLTKPRGGSNSGHKVELPATEELLAKFDRRDFGILPSLPLVALVVHSGIADHSLPEFMFSSAVKEIVEDYEHNPNEPLCTCGQEDCLAGQIERLLRAYDARAESARNSEGNEERYGANPA